MPLVELYVLQAPNAFRSVGGSLEQWDSVSRDWLPATDPIALTTLAHPRRGKHARENDWYYSLISEVCEWDPDIGGAQKRVDSGNPHPGGTCRYCEDWPPGGTVYQLEQAEWVDLERYNIRPGNPTKRFEELMDEDQALAIIAIDHQGTVVAEFR
jgi:hypothetical protein